MGCRKAERALAQLSGSKALTVFPFISPNLGLQGKRLIAQYGSVQLSNSVAFREVHPGEGEMRYSHALAHVPGSVGMKSAGCQGQMTVLRAVGSASPSWSVDEPEPRGSKSPGVGKGTVGSRDCMRQPQHLGVCN